MTNSTSIEALQNTFIQIEHEARHAESLESLSFLMVNSTKKLLNYHQAVFWRKTSLGKVRIETISGTGLINRDSPYLIWLQKIMSLISLSKKASVIHPVNKKGFRASLSADWDEWCPPYVLWCPLVTVDQQLLGGLWLTRDTPWPEGEVTLIQELLDAYSHAWHALRASTKLGWLDTLKQDQNKKRLKYLGFAAAILLLFPIRQTVLAPAEIVAKEPMLISSPLDGVVSSIYVDPNQAVKAGQKLFSLDDTTFINQYRVAQKSLLVAQEKYRKAGQHAFENQDSKSQLAVLKAEVEKYRAQLRYAKSILDDITVKAPGNGVAIFSSKHEWVGKPIVTGQKVMQVADPRYKALDIWLPVSDAIGLHQGSAVKLFLNVSPLSSNSAKVEYVSYEASAQPDGTLAYLVRAQFPVGEEVSRIGLQGTAKLYGDRVILAYYLFWRPISALRRFIGV